MKDIPAIKGRHYIASLIEQGEHEQQDFKYVISDARKIARSISAFANNGGGRLLIGVKDNGTVAGVRNEEDVYVVEAAAEIYCRPAVEVDFTAFKVDPGVVVIRASIAAASHRPIFVAEDGGELRAYFRVKDENIVASAEMVEAWRLQSLEGGSTLDFGDNHRRLLDMINDRGPVTLHDFVLASHLPTSVATHVAASLIATGALSPAYINRRWHLAP